MFSQILSVMFGVAVLSLVAFPVRAEVADPACFRRGSALVPVGATHTLPLYPAESVTANEQGKVVMRVFIGTDGVPSDVVVETSSGSKRLDDASASWVKQVWRWRPLKDDCTTVNTLVAVDWSLAAAGQLPVLDANLRILVPLSSYPEGARQKREEGVTKIEVFVSQVGSILYKRVSVGSGFEDLDQKAVELLAKLQIEPAKIDGAPAQGAFLVEFVWSLNGKDPLRR